MWLTRLWKFSNTRSLGERAETHASKWLRRKGLRLIARNYRCAHGEIDIIAQHQSELVFVEVRYRNRDNTFGGALESISLGKQRKLTRAAAHFLIKHPQYQDWPCRFDALIYDDTWKPEWIVAAFVSESL